MANDTRERILDEAEALFAARGFATTSLRALTQAADANLAAVHYHFGSKEGLLDAVLERRARGANQDRLADLARLEAGAAPATVEEILSAFVVPGVRSLEQLHDRRPVLMQLRSRLEAESPELVESLLRKHFGPVCSRFLEALERALPHVGKELLADRFRFALGSLSFAFSSNFDLDTLPGHPPVRSSESVKVDRLIDFLAAGLRADVPAPRSSS